MGIVCDKGIATTIESLPGYTWTVPHDMSLEEAVTIPVIYAIVIWALFFKMQLEEGASILIHGGTEDISQAAINICLHYKCTIFTTVGCSKQKEFIRKTYPQIPESHICYNSDSSFETIVKEQTKSQGVDIVLNNLSGSGLQASVRCLGLGGHFFELGKFDMTENNPLELSPFLNDITFHCIHLDEIMYLQNEIMCNFYKKMQKMVDCRIIKPIQRTIFQANQIELAFRCVARGRNSGKVVIKIRNEENNFRTIPNLICIELEPRVLCKRNKSYIIIGDSNGFEFGLVEWLISRGTQNVILCLPCSIRNNYHVYRIKEWQSYGINVIVLNEDATKEKGAENVLQKASCLGPVAGIFYVSMVHQTQKGTITVVHLDRLSRKLCTDLEYFVMFSNNTQGNENLNQDDCHSNSTLEKISELRQANNLPALLIQKKTYDEIQMTTDSINENGETSECYVKSYLNSMDSLMKQPNPIIVATFLKKKSTKNSDIMNHIANVLGITKLENKNVYSTLSQLGMNSILAVEIQETLESQFDISFTLKELQNKTIAQLYELTADQQPQSKLGAI